jgi:hypothetical protein
MRRRPVEGSGQPGPSITDTPGASPRRVLLIFLDGVGIGLDDAASNPFFRARLPSLRTLLGGEMPHLDAPEVETSKASAFPLDALLGVEGLPQSGTGQTALLTGRNAPAIYGRHFGPWVPVRLRPLLKEQNLLSRAQEFGFSCAFANAYPRGFQQSRWARRPAAPPLAAQAAGLLTRHQEELARGRAVSSEIVNTTWRERLALPHLPDVTPREAGANLAAIAAGVRLTFFAHYATDLAGHSRRMKPAVEALERVDAFLGGLIPYLDAGTLLVVASDHGNIEEATTGHTRNPTLGLLVGAGAPTLRKGLESLTDVAQLILDYLTVE